MKYNDKWTREMFVEYRKLKRSGYSDKQLKDHFGESIWYSGLYNKNASVLPWFNFINEIKIEPLDTKYDIQEKVGLYHNDKLDYFANFEYNEYKYVVCLFYYEINNIPTYNVAFTTKENFDKYINTYTKYKEKGYITYNEFEELTNIFEELTNNHIFIPLLTRLSYIIFDMYNKKMKDIMLSIGDTTDERKIKTYRNIIQNSFENISETIEYFNDNKYYLYEIN